MDHLSTPGQAPAAFASRPAAAPRTVSVEVAAGTGSATEPGAKASYQDALLFIAPPLLSAAVLGALSMNLHRIPSAHPLADASLLCAGAVAILIAAWWFISFIYALFYAWSLRVSSHNADRTVLKVPAIFRPRFMRRIVLTLGGTALGVGAVLAPAQATVATPSNAGVNGTEGMPQTTISAVMAADSSITAAADASSDAVLSDTAPNQSATPLTLSAEVPNIPLAPEPSEAAGYLQDRSPFFSPPRTEAGTYSYTVQAGDTLWSIAADQLGEGTDASTIYDYTLDIYEANKDALGQNAELLYEGQVLQIPEQPVH
ncbi:LysM peptidoglycan-binding domain-containing protein [Rothia mucilaginosa]|uniref:LysM peptidoglycan-binding domain-containing protein n=1 Tax=Rothia TaxID=32207 RepID=UPI0008A28D34|nr:MULTISPECIES: LysM peptidoglycan-binding domain-containing protein [Rothia]MBF1665801.1 LysM peptidoglycan-binding domain-containing protein [Rothia sp. (in: high G+C Gram-positive bacteria)]MBF1668258.1 LysM peptidoglycan-binding domain-containing protein [Rothia sp. (in: high G+C Gram-positive bacteria)]OFQ59497.1 peptidoglycan-binding protein LysM [Rothia sp. HMSC072B04]OHQ12488.1 peptidoglycan-binding protein LysM [Rothia sp. HMSC064F07]PLA63165.1 LysM peptidoglycan-binding domain-conta